MKVVSILMVIAMIATPVFAQAQVQGDVWRLFAQKVDVGTRVTIRLDDGRRIVATLIQADADVCSCTRGRGFPYPSSTSRTIGLPRSNGTRGAASARPLPSVSAAASAPFSACS